MMKTCTAFFALLLAILAISDTRAQCANQPRNTNCGQGLNRGNGGPGCVAGSRFFFNNIDRTCREINYFGCGGNNNRFCTERQCRDACRRGGTGGK